MERTTLPYLRALVAFLRLERTALTLSSSSCQQCIPAIGENDLTLSSNSCQQRIPVIGENDPYFIFKLLSMSDSVTLRKFEIGVVKSCGDLRDRRVSVCVLDLVRSGEV